MTTEQQATLPQRKPRAALVVAAIAFATGRLAGLAFSDPGYIVVSIVLGVGSFALTIIGAVMLTRVRPRRGIAFYVALALLILSAAAIIITIIAAIALLAWASGVGAHAGQG